MPDIRRFINRINGTDCRDADADSLFNAVMFGNLAEVKRLVVDCGIDPNIQGFNGDTPLHFAARRDNCVVVKLLLNHGADPTIRNKKGRTPRDYGSNCRGLIEELRRGGTRTTVYE